MANHKSAAKRARQTVRKTEVNSRISKTVRTFEKKVRLAVANKDADLAQTNFRLFASRIDRAVKKGIFHPNKAARKISQLSKLVS